MQNKTKVILMNDVHQSLLKKGDKGYVDGYINGGDSRPYAVFVRFSDGLIDLTPIYNVQAVIKKPRSSKDASKISIAVIDLYNNVMAGTSAQQTKAATKKLTSKIDEFCSKHFQTANDWRVFFESLKRSDFLMGKVQPNSGYRRFKLKLSWVINDENLAKIINGEYHE